MESDSDRERSLTTDTESEYSCEDVSDESSDSSIDGNSHSEIHVINDSKFTPVFLPSNKGRNSKLFLHGYCYILDKVRNGTMYWRCTRYVMCF